MASDCSSYSILIVRNDMDMKDVTALAGKKRVFRARQKICFAGFGVAGIGPQQTIDNVKNRVQRPS